MARNKKNKSMELEGAEQGFVEAAPLGEQQEEAANQPRKRAEAPKVQFDGWWAARSAMIPSVHKKEIIKADMKGRKVPMIATMAEFDEALKKYGVALE